MKKILIILFFFLFAVTACNNKGPKETSQSEEFKFKVKVVQAEKQVFQKFVNYKGTVSAWQTANIMPEVSGRIAVIHKNIGDLVSRGEVVAELDLTALKLQEKQAEAGLSISERGYQDASLNYERMQKLYEKNAVSSFQLEKAQLAMTAAQTQLESSRATLDFVRYNIDKSRMKAPFAGIVSARNLEVGDMVNPMMGTGRPVLVLLDLSRVKVIVDLNSEDVERIGIGQTCRVKIAGVENELTGKVFSKNLAADPGSKSFRVEIAVPNEDRKIRAYVFADVWIQIDKREDVLVLPLTALLLDKYLMVVENGKARQIEVKAGINNGSEFIVEEGLNPGQTVIVEGNYDLQDGQEVTF